MNGYFMISGQASVPPTTCGDVGQPGGPTTLDGSSPWPYGIPGGGICQSWGYTLPNDTTLYVTDILFQTKYINISAGSSPSSNIIYGLRSSMLMIYGVHTVPDHCPHIHLRCPIIVPPGKKLSALCFNHDNDGSSQNMIGTMLGYCFDNPTDEAKFWYSR